MIWRFIVMPSHNYIFGHEALQVYHSRERGSSDPVVEAYDVEVALDSGGVGSTVGYKLDLGGDPVDGYRVFLGVPLDSVGDGEVLGLKYRMSGLGNLQEEDVVAQVRVLQYYEGGGASYYVLRDWAEVEGAGEQTLNIPIDRERVAAGGRTYVEWRFAKRGGGSGVFVDKGIDLRNVRMEELRVGWYTKTVYSCEEEDNYRYGFNTQEKVNEVSGKGNHYTAPYWEYDPRTGRRWNLDPVDQVSISNYATNRNNPIVYTDPLGDYSKFGAQWRNFVNSGKGISYTKSTGEWGYSKGIAGGTSYRDGLSKATGKERIGNYERGHVHTPQSAEERVGRLYEPIIRAGEWFQSLGDRHFRVSNDQWNGGGSWEGDRMWEKKGKPLAVAITKFNLAWSTAGIGGYAVNTLSGATAWAGIAFGADGVVDAASEGKYSVKAAVGNKFGGTGIALYNSSAIVVDIMSLSLGIKPMAKGSNMAAFPASSIIATDDVATTKSDYDKSNEKK